MVCLMPNLAGILFLLLTVDIAFPLPIQPKDVKTENGRLSVDDRESVGTCARVVLEWNISKYEIKLKKRKSLTVLRSIAGRAENGSFNAVMGPSGCGKTSLLQCLALRTRDFEGSLTLNGKALTGAYFAHTGYVHQKELFFPHLTVREHLVFHALNHLSRHKSLEECVARVEAVMEEVDLTKVGDQKIGGGDLYLVAGISGGERKRLNIASELLGNPRILLLDEPTSGLDSVMGELVCLLLKNIAVQAPRRLVIAAIHTPSSRVFTLVSHVTLLTSHGELAYWGPRDKLLLFLEGLGYRCPSYFNPADFILELASAKVIAGQAGAPGGVGGQELASPGNVSGSLLVESTSSGKLVAACKSTFARDVAPLGVDNRHKEVVGVQGPGASDWAVSFRTNLWRSWLSQRREYVGLAVAVLMNTALGLVFGVLYFQQIPHDNGRNTAGYLFSLLVTLLIASSIAVCMNFPFDFAILMREYYAGVNSPLGYFLGRTLASEPPSLAFMIMGILPYFMVGLAPSAVAFGWYCLLFFIVNFAAQSIGYLASSFSANPVVGLSILPLFITPMILFSGMLYERNSVPPSLRWIQDISVMNYSFALMVLNQVGHIDGPARSFLIDFLQIKHSDFPGFLIALVSLSILYRVAAMGVLWVRVKFFSKVQ